MPASMTAAAANAAYPVLSGVYIPQPPAEPPVNYRLFDDYNLFRGASGSSMTLGNLGIPYYPPDGMVVGGALSIIAKNISGFYSSSVGQSIVLGTGSTDGLPDDKGSAGGVNGGFGLPGIAGLQAMLSYGGVDAVGQFVGAGPYLPPIVPGVTLSGPLGLTVTLPPGSVVALEFQRPNTWIRLTGLTSTLVGMLDRCNLDGTAFTVKAWGDLEAKSVGTLNPPVGVNATSYGFAAGASQITAMIGWVSHVFGHNTVSVCYPWGPDYVTGHEYDIINDSGTPQSKLSSGVVINGQGGNYQIGAGLSIGGRVGSGDLASGAFMDGIQVAGCSYRCVWVNMDLDGNPAHNAVVGTYYQTIGGIPIVIYNKNVVTPDGSSNVLAINGQGDLYTVGLIHAGTIQSNGGYTVRNATGLNQMGSWDGNGLLSTSSIFTHSITTEGLQVNGGISIRNLSGLNQFGTWDTNGNLAALGFVQAASLQTGGPSGPTWLSGNGVPTSVQPPGSLYSRLDGTTGTRLYVSSGGGWSGVAGV